MADDDRYDRKSDRPYDKRRGPRKGGFNKGRGGYGSGGKKDYRPRDGEKREFKPRDGGEGRREFRPRDGDDRGKREFRPRDGDRPRNGGGRGGPNRGGGRRDFEPRDGERKEFRPRDGDDRGKREFRPRDRDDRGRGDFRPRNGGGRGDRRGSRDNRDRNGRDDRRGDREFRPREERTEEPKPMQEQKLTIPSTPQRILFKGVDCEVNGRTDLAMVLYLHGAVMHSKGCENNAVKMLRTMGPGEFSTVRGRVAKMCSEDAMIEYDYLCWTVDRTYDRSAVDAAAEAGNNLAIYCRIREEEVEGDDPCIDVFASGHSENPERVEEGLRFIARKKDSAKAERQIELIEDRKKLRQSLRGTFVKARKGDRGSMHKLEELSGMFPEAGFLRGFLDAEDQEQYLKDNYGEHRDTMVNMEAEFCIQDRPFGMFLKAKKLQKNEEEWIPLMIEAAKAGSDEAMEELKPVQNRRDVRKSFSSIYLANGDVAKLVESYDGADTFWLDKYCEGDMERIAEVGRTMGGAREIDWLKKNYRDGIEGCRDLLIDLASVEDRQCKQLVYALHDVGADVSAAKLYFEMFGDPTLPAIKWLAKVCQDEAAKEYVRSQFESMGDLATFDSIFVDDGYFDKGQRRGSGGRSGGRQGGRRDYGHRDRR